VHSWINPTSVVGGVLAVVAAAYLSAVYLEWDARRLGQTDMVEYFRRRAVASAVVVAVIAAAGAFVLRWWGARGDVVPAAGADGNTARQFRQYCHGPAKTPTSPLRPRQKSCVRAAGSRKMQPGGCPCRLTSKNASN